MCTGSVYAKHREATDKERLVVKELPKYDGIKGYYPAPGQPDANRLVCVRGVTTKAIIKVVKFVDTLDGHAPLLKAWSGKRNVEVTLRHRPYADAVQMPDGTNIPLMYFAEGMRLDIGIPVRVRKPAAGKAGMKVVKGALREALALPPEPKPDEADVPAKPVEPEREPAPVGDAPAARRRR